MSVSHQLNVCIIYILFLAQNVASFIVYFSGGGNDVDLFGCMSRVYEYHIYVLVYLFCS